MERNQKHVQTRKIAKVMHKKFKAEPGASAIKLRFDTEQEPFIRLAEM